MKISGPSMIEESKQDYIYKRRYLIRINLSLRYVEACLGPKSSKIMNLFNQGNEWSSLFCSSIIQMTLIK